MFFRLFKWITIPFLVAFLSFSAAYAETAHPIDIRMLLAQITTPEVYPYRWSAQKNDAGTIVLNGYVPGISQRDEITAIAGKKVLDATSIATGEPDNFLPTLRIGLEALALLNIGEIRLGASGWAVEGEAPSREIEALVRTRLERVSETNNGEWQIDINIVAQTSTELETYKWMASKSDAGELMFDGQVPNFGVRGLLISRSGGEVDDQSDLVPGGPEGFTYDALAAISVLDLLRDGEVGFDGRNWIISGTLELSATFGDLAGLLNAASTPRGAWEIDVIHEEPTVASTDVVPDAPSGSALNVEEETTSEAAPPATMPGQEGQGEEANAAESLDVASVAKEETTEESPVAVSFTGSPTYRFVAKKMGRFTDRA